MSRLWAVVITLAIVFPAPSQQQPEVSLLALATEKGVWLRWFLPLEQLPDGGFHLYRRAVTTDQWTRLTSHPLKPVPDAEGKRLLGEDGWEAIATFLYPERVLPDPKKAPPSEFVSAARFRKEQGKILSLLLLTDLSVAKALGLFFEDKTAEQGAVYAYRLTGVAQDGTETPFAELPQVVVQPDPPFPAPAGIVVARTRGGVALLWRLDTPQATFTTSYNIYRQAKPDEKPIRLNEFPLIVALSRDKAGNLQLPREFFVDATVQVGQTYFYRVCGVDFFGRESEPSPPQSITVQPLIALDPPEGVAAAVDGATVRLIWKPVTDASVKGYHVYRSDSAVGNFRRLTAQPVSAPTYLDRDLEEGSFFYYRITSVDAEGKESPQSLAAIAIIVDKTPPKPPTQLQAHPQRGKVTLTWQSSPDKDVEGYRIYRSTERDGTYMLVTAELVPEQSFSEELPEKARNLFWYKVRTVDRAGNESGESEPISVQLPDVTPPPAPTIKSIVAGDGSLTIVWLPVQADDLVGYHLYRGETRQAVTTKLTDQPLSIATTSFTDKGLEANKPYFYIVEAIDKSGNSARSEPLGSRCYDQTPPKPPTDLQVKVSDDGQGLVITWRNPDGEKSVRATVFRADKRDGTYERISVLLPPDVTTFTDTRLRFGQTYFYKVQLTDPSGNQSELSEASQGTLPQQEEKK